MVAPIRAGVAAAVVLALAALGPAPLAGDDADKVVVSRPGVVFHSFGSADLRGRGAEKTREEALASGYTPCPVCFAVKAGPVVAASTLAGGAAIASGRGGVVLPPVLSPLPLAQPFGERCFISRGRRGSHELVKNPYREPETIRNPGHEPGAYSEPW